MGDLFELELIILTVDRCDWRGGRPGLALELVLGNQVKIVVETGRVNENFK